MRPVDFSAREQGTHPQGMGVIRADVSCGGEEYGVYGRQLAVSYPLSSNLPQGEGASRLRTLTADGMHGLKTSGPLAG